MRRILQAATLALLMLASACSERSESPQPARETAAPATRPTPAIALAGRVTDAAGILDPALEARLSDKLAQLERATGRQLVVVTAPSLGGRDVADFTRDLGNAWRIGRAEQDDGVVFLVAPKERQARIAVGYGLEQTLTNAECKEILDRQIFPRFRKGDLPGGIEAGVDALVSKLR